VCSAPIKQRGFSLAELMFVVFVLAICVAITVPPVNGRSALRLERAADEVVAALAYARGEAERTHVPHGVRVQSGRRITVFRLDTSKTPPTEIYDVRDPVDKSIYDVDLAGGAFTQNTTATGWFLFQRQASGATAASFDANGEPMRGDDRLPLATGGVLLANEGSTLAVSLAALTGRITVGQVSGPVANPATAFPAPVGP
jgi:prepilin-type N-terminal cleavage/methylation domain-containing protein